MARCHLCSFDSVAHCQRQARLEPTRPAARARRRSRSLGVRLRRLRWRRGNSSPSPRTARLPTLLRLGSQPLAPRERTLERVGSVMSAEKRRAGPLPTLLRVRRPVALSACVGSGGGAARPLLAPASGCGLFRVLYERYGGRNGAGRSYQSLPSGTLGLVHIGLCPRACQCKKPHSILRVLDGAIIMLESGRHMPAGPLGRDRHIHLGFLDQHILNGALVLANARWQPRAAHARLCMLHGACCRTCWMHTELVYASLSPQAGASYTVHADGAPGACSRA